MKKIVILFVLIANTVFSQSGQGLVVFNDGTFIVKDNGKSYAFSADSDQLLVTGDKKTRYISKSNEDIKALYQNDEEMWITEDESGVNFYLHNHLVAQYEPYDIDETDSGNIRHIFNLDDGTIKIVADEVAYEISADNEEMMLLGDENIKYALVYFEEDIRGFCENKDDITITEDETGIYFYYKDYLLSKYENKYIKLAYARNRQQ